MNRQLVFTEESLMWQFKRSDNYIIRNYMNVSRQYSSSSFLVMDDHSFVTSYPHDAFCYVMTLKKDTYQILTPRTWTS